MILADAYFENIQTTIQRELLMAKRTVYVAVAWFTDEVLFNSLLQLQGKNIHVQLCIVKDDLNFKNNGLPFDALNSTNTKFFATTNDKMHHKFCVIDESVVITGSYNWTYKAATGGKDENIIITSGDFELAQKFIREFLKITNQQNGYGRIADMAKVLKRCRAILNLLQLDEVEDVHKQAQRLQTEAASNQSVCNISEHLMQNRFAVAIDEINILLNKYQTIEVYEDPIINGLKLEIKLLEYQLIALENEKAEAENIVFEYDRLFNEILGECVDKYLLLKKKLKEQTKATNPTNAKAAKEYEEAEADYKTYKKSYEETRQQAKEFIEFTNPEDAARLKKMYREAAILCHPDKFMNEPKKWQQAEAIFKELVDAYQMQDIKKVQTILRNLQQGVWEMNESNTNTNNIEILKSVLERLQHKFRQLLKAIEKIKEGEAYLHSKKESNLKDHFAKLKNDIERQIIELEKELTVYEHQ